MRSPLSRLVRALVAVVAVGGIQGCKRGTRADLGTREGILSYANNAEPSDLDPNTNIDGSTDTILNALYEGLVRLSNDGHTVLPGVARSWEVSPDGKTYTFHLRPDALWSNGAPVTSDDFLFSFRRVLDPMLACEKSSFGFAIRGAEDYAKGRARDAASLGLEAPDPSTFVIRLGHPAPYLLSLLGIGSPFMPVYRPLLEKFGGVHQRGTPWTREANIVSNGPFVLARWTPNRVIEVRKNPRYWDRDRVRLSGVDIYPTDDASAQERGFRAGEFHMTTRIPIFKAAAYESEQPGVLHRDPILGTHFVTFNLSRAPFVDARVRRALSMAIDRRKLSSAVYGSFAEPAFAQVRPGTGGYAPPSAAGYRFDPDGARRLLGEAGHPGGAGLPPIELMLVGNDPQTVNIGEVVQAAWRDVLGVTAQLYPTEEKVYLDAERSKNYHAMIEEWDSPWDDPSAFYQIGATGNPNNDAGWSDPEFDRAYKEADDSVDPEVRRRAFDVQEARLAESMPYAPLYYWNKPMLVLPSVRGWVPNAFGHVEWKEISLER